MYCTNYNIPRGSCIICASVIEHFAFAIKLLSLCFYLICTNSRFSSFVCFRVNMSVSPYVCIESNVIHALKAEDEQMTGAADTKKMSEG